MRHRLSWRKIIGIIAAPICSRAEVWRSAAVHGAALWMSQMEASNRFQSHSTGLFNLLPTR